MRGSPTALLYFDNAKVHKSKLLGDLNKGYYMVVKGFEIERITISAISTGIALKCLEWIVKYSKERVAFSKPISEFQLIQEKVARISAKLEVLRTYLYLSAKFYDPKKDNRVQASTLKYLCGKLGVEAGLEAIQVLGGYGYTKDYPVERLMRDAKLNDIGAGTTEMMILQLAKMVYKHFK
jgi:isovaleryl-CoA dehydrogenase